MNVIIMAIIIFQHLTVTICLHAWIELLLSEICVCELHLKVADVEFVIIELA